MTWSSLLLKSETRGLSRGPKCPAVLEDMSVSGVSLTALSHSMQASTLHTDQQSNPRPLDCGSRTFCQR